MAMVRHEYFESCEEQDCGGICPQCSLSICKNCGLMEGSLTTECCEKPVSFDMEEKIYAGLIDYRNGRWILEMRNRPMYGKPERDLAHEKRYLRLLLEDSVIDLERVQDCKRVISEIESILVQRR